MTTETTPGHKRRRWRPTPMQAMGGLVALTLVVGGGNLWASYAEVQTVKAGQHHDDVARAKAGLLIEAKLCSTFGRLAALKPPPGDPKTNPSRAFLQDEHATLVQLGDDLGCRP